MEHKKTLVAMSGGVDSSAAAKLLLDEGHEVAGAVMRLSPESDSAVEGAKKAAERLGIELHVFDFSREFSEYVVGNFTRTYLDGGTPNPCVQCNKHLKFGRFLDRALELGFDSIATGHYVGCEFDESRGRWVIKRARDRRKDQSYVLYGLTQRQLSHTVFPLYELSKPQIREIAARSGLADPKQSESQDICFIPDGDYAAFITRRAGEQQQGEITLTDGSPIGMHKGLIHYTVGQRRGIGVSYSEPLFVVEKDTARNRLVLGTADELARSSLEACEVNFMAFENLTEPLRCTCQTRYHQTDAACTVYPAEDGNKVRVEFEVPHRAAAPGQSVVFYDGDTVLGGGIIV